MDVDGIDVDGNHVVVDYNGRWSMVLLSACYDDNA